MSVWDKYSLGQRNEYIKFLQVYGALSNLFRQKKGDLVPHLDSKFQETIFAKIFKCKNVDFNNTPHDVLAVFGDERIGIGLKTWMYDKPSYQKVMQLKKFQNVINDSKSQGLDALAYKISEIKNQRMIFDYNRLGLTKENNIYHYITREKGQFIINECTYPLIDLDNLGEFSLTDSGFSWTDKKKDYKFTFGDCQVYQKFDSQKYDTRILEKFEINILEDPFKFLLDAYLNIADITLEADEDIYEVYLPLYSYKTKEVEEKSGLNAWNASPKNKGSDTLRPLNEVYIPIPREFHQKFPDFFTNSNENLNKPEIRFNLQLPNGKKIPSLVTQSNMKGLQSGSNHELDENGKRYGQSALGQWLLIDVLGLRERKLVTRDWLELRGTDSVKLWRNKNDFSVINIDFAPLGSFEEFMLRESKLTEI
jgi:hypothetical protein